MRHLNTNIIRYFKGVTVFNKLVRFLNRVEEIALAYVSLGLAILIVTEIILRSTGIIAFYWLEELGRYVLIFMTLCGASMAVKNDSHPKMTAIFMLISTKAGHVLRAIVYLFLSGFFAFFDYFAWFNIKETYMLKMQTSTLGLPFYIPYLPIAIFVFVMCVRYFIAALKEFQALHNESGA